MRLIGTMIMAAAVTVVVASAQNVVNQRRENQQDRVAQGVQSGQLTAGETGNLETKEAALNQEVHTDRTLNGGKLNNQERQTVNQQQNQLSKQIYADKHNAVTQPTPTTKVGARRENQQDRIGNGIASGRLTAGQAAKLEKGAVGINQQVRADRTANGGTLTASQRNQINREQNQQSRKIYRAKHA